MNQKQKIIEHIEDVGVTQNELVDSNIINRTLKKLLENDILLNDYIEKNFGGVIQQYNKNVQYKNGSLVWLKYDGKLYLLRKIQKQDVDSIDDPIKAITTGDYERHGWKDENKILDPSTVQESDIIGKYLRQLFIQHERNSDYHYFGELTQETHYGKDKILLNDISNLKSDRKTTFFPNQTTQISPDNAIIKGYYRVWDSGLLEMDIIYRMGYVGVDKTTGLERIDCNKVHILESENENNNKYFQSTTDMNIFDYASQDEYRDSSIIGNTIQCNRNDFVNTYSANISFPIMKGLIDGENVAVRMSDENYMIFSSDIMSNDGRIESRKTMETSNHVTYINRTTNGFTSLLITYSPNESLGVEEGYNAKNGGLVNNTFHCHIVGRWVIV